jgi:DNA-binding transcriptional MerR regulator
MKSTQPSTSSALQPFAPSPDELYSIEAVAHLTQTPRHLIAVYCRHGLIAPVTPPEQDGWRFDDEAIYELRRLAGLRAAFGLEPPALQLLVEMRRELEQLRAEMRFLRSR